MRPSGLIARSLLRAWRRHPFRAWGAIVGVVLGAALTTLVVSINDSVSSAARAASGSGIVKADLAVQARSAGGISYELGRRVDRAVPDGDVSAVVQVNSRLAGDGNGNGAVLSILGVEQNARAFLPPNVTEDLVRRQAAPGTQPLVVGAEWLARNDLAVGDLVRLQGPRGTESWTVVGAVPGGLPNNGAIAAAPIDSVARAFDRPDSLDTLYVQLPPGADDSVVGARLRSIVGAAAVVGSPAIVGAANARSLLIVQAMLLVVGLIGLASAAIVVFVCWRLLLEDERASIARFRLAGATPAQLALGAGMVMLAATLACCVVGLPTGLLVADLLRSNTSELVGFTGLAASFGSGDVLVPVGAGLTGAVAVAGLAWVAGVATFVAVPALEAVRPPDPPAQTQSTRLRTISAGCAALVLSALSLLVLPLELAVAGVLLALVGALLVTVGTPVSIGRLMARLDGGFVSLAGGRHISADARRTAAITLMVGLGVTASLTVGGVITSYQSAIERSVRSWTHADLFVRQGEPGQTLRDLRFPPAVRQRLAHLPGVAEAGAFTFAPIDYHHRNVMFQAYDTDHVRGIADLIVYSGASGPALWRSLGRGEIAISQGMARLDSLGVGDSVEVPSTKGERRLKIASVIDDYISEGGTLVGSLETFEDVTGERRIDDIPLVLEPGVSAAQMAARVKAALSGYESLSLLDRSQFRASITGFITNVSTLFKGLALVAFIIILMAATLTLAASLSVRRRSLAVGQVCGETPRQIRRQLCLETAGMALVAWVVAAVVTCLLIPSILRAMAVKTGLLPSVVLPKLEIAVALPLGLGVALIAAVLVARMIRSKSIVETLHFE